MIYCQNIYFVSRNISEIADITRALYLGHNLLNKHNPVHLQCFWVYIVKSNIGSIKVLKQLIEIYN